MQITPSVFEAYLKCPTKCWLRATGEPASGNPYAEWIEAQDVCYRASETTRLLSTLPRNEVTVSPNVETVKAAKWRFACTLAVQREMNSCRVESEVHAVERVPAGGRGKPVQYIPIRFVFRNKLTNEDRLLLAFDAIMISRVFGQEAKMGRIVHGDDHARLKVKTSLMAGEVRKHIERIATLLSNPTAPDLVLNRHCAECEFQTRCRQKALEQDDLSLLAGMSAKERQKLRHKGIFTITQFSYTFRPRRRSKRLPEQREKYHLSLRALAIREKQIHIVGDQGLKIEGTPVFLDVEGLPDLDFYYLIGLRIGNGASAVQHSLWADTPQDERTIWREFLGILKTVARPVLVHYGSYETTFLRRMRERYGHAHRDFPSTGETHSLNLLAHIYARVYFPTYSNGLKDIAGCCGFKWSGAVKSGTAAVALRHDWERSRDGSIRRGLIEYNREDCAGLETLARQLTLLHARSGMCSDADLLDGPKVPATKRGKDLSQCLNSVLKSAHWKYKEKEISLRTCEKAELGGARKKVARENSRRRILPSRGGQTIRVARKRKCPWHPEYPTVLKRSKKEAEHALLDIAFTKSGCKKILVRYIGNGGYCPHCHTTHAPLAIQRLRGRTFGFGFYALVVYLRVKLRLSLRLIAELLRDMFQEPISHEAVERFVVQSSEGYAGTEEMLFVNLFQSAAIHIDETKISILGTLQFVWVLTDSRHVVFHLTPRRETDFLTDLLRGYQGTVVTDFYGGYDALPCRQQKCIVHLIRDLNDDLWKNPFDDEYEGFVSAVRDLLVPILEDVQRFGLKEFHLRKHVQSVERFYQITIHGLDSCKEVTAKYVKRFLRYRESLFTFMEDDGVPWNNNAAERAIRHLAVQRKISGAFTTKGANHYLRLLGIAQTCRFQEKSFLGFLLSGLKNVDAYSEPRGTRKR